MRSPLLPAVIPALVTLTLPVTSEAQVIENSIGMKLVRIPAGTFTMGSPRSEAERLPNEVLHEVTITKPFYIGMFEVTQAQYNTVRDNDRNPVFQTGRGGGPHHPMENIEWKRAVLFCRDLSRRAPEARAGRRYRLPTEAEWEYACRAGTETVFHTGDALSSHQANFNGNYPFGNGVEGPHLERTTRVGSYEPNAFGLYDMHGNVAEWCSDYYDPDYYENSPEEDPSGPPFGVLPTNFDDFHRVVRGGCWLDDARGCRSAYRFRAMPGTVYRIIGFRVVCEVDGESD